MISQTSLEKFKEIYQRTFNERLDDAEALDRANRLLNIYLAVYGNPLEEKVDREVIELPTNKQNEYEKAKKEK